MSDILDITRIVLVGAAFYFGYQVGFAGETQYDAAGQLHIMVPLVIVAIAGLSGIEGLFFGRQAAEAKGYEVGSNYQKQSAFALISFTVTAVLVFFLGWGLLAELTILFVFMFFFLMSAANHAVNAIKNHNYTWQNINRPFLILLVMAGFAYPLAQLWSNLPQ